MIPLRLEFEGFARFRERQVLDFDGLELFAITGPTGAGKTLILDALSFALYGVTARQSRMVDSLINTESQRLAVDLQFQAAAGTYRVGRTMERRASGTVSKSARLEQLLDGTWTRVPETEKLTEVNAKLIGILGLDFQAFTRSILLPQGKFDEFLHGEPRQRRELLKELLGLKRVDSMREEAGRRERGSAARVEALTAQLEADDLASAVTRQRELRTELAALEQSLVQTGQALDGQRERLREAEVVAQLHAELEQVAVELSSQQEAARQAPELQNELERGQRAAALVPLHGHLERLAERLRRAQSGHEELQARLPGLTEALGTARAEAQRAAQALEEEESGLLAQLEALQAVLPLARQLNRLGGAPAGPEADPGSFAEEKLERLLELKASLPALRSAEERVARARAAAERAGSDARAAAAEVQRLSASRDEVLQEGQASGVQLEALREQLKHAELHAAEHTVALRDSLTVGATCPVCDQEVTRLPDVVSSEFGVLRQQLQAHETRHKELQERYRELEGRVREQQLLHSTHLRTEQEQTEELTAASEGLATELDRYEPEGFTGTAQAVGAAVEESLAIQRAALAALIGQQTGGLEPEERVAATRQQLEQLRAAVQSTERQLNQVEREHDQLSSQLELRGQALVEQQTEFTEQEREFTRQLQAADFSNVADLQAAIRTPERLQELSQLLERTSREIARLTERQQELHGQLAGRPDSRPGLGQLKEQVAGLEEQLRQQRERRGAVQAGLEQQAGLVKRRHELTEERRKLEEERSLWRQLALDLQENRFTDFLLADLQRRLAHHASRIIRQVTGDRFDLHLSESGEFEVSDAWAGGERRTARSLSGGETFIVSLALALALSDAAGGSRRLGALFLDEGFGTLDAQTLDSVAAVLEGLSGEGRLVGIITHVSELAERLPDRLVVVKEAHGSSLRWDD